MNDRYKKSLDIVIGTKYTGSAAVKKAQADISSFDKIKDIVIGGAVVSMVAKSAAAGVMALSTLRDKQFAIEQQSLTGILESQQRMNRVMGELGGAVPLIGESIKKAVDEWYNTAALKAHIEKVKELEAAAKKYAETLRKLSDGVRLLEIQAYGGDADEAKVAAARRDDREALRAEAENVRALADEAKALRAEGQHGAARLTDRKAAEAEKNLLERIKAQAQKYAVEDTLRAKAAAEAQAKARKDAARSETEFFGDEFQKREAQARAAAEAAKKARLAPMGLDKELVELRRKRDKELADLYARETEQTLAVDMDATHGFQDPAAMHHRELKRTRIAEEGARKRAEINRNYEVNSMRARGVMEREAAAQTRDIEAKLASDLAKIRADRLAAEKARIAAVRAEAQALMEYTMSDEQRRLAAIQREGDAMIERAVQNGASERALAAIRQKTEANIEAARAEFHEREMARIEAEKAKREAAERARLAAIQRESDLQTQLQIDIYRLKGETLAADALAIETKYSKMLEDATDATTRKMIAQAKALELAKLTGQTAASANPAGTEIQAQQFRFLRNAPGRDQAQALRERQLVALNRIAAILKEQSDKPAAIPVEYVDPS